MVRWIGVMLRVPIDQALPDMPLATPVLHPHNPARTLLRSGAKLNERTINRLRDQGVLEVWIAWPGLEFLSDSVNPQLDQSHRELTHKLGKVFDSAANDLTAGADYASLKGSISDFLDKMLESPRSAFFLSELLGAGQPMLRHASGVCLLSLLMGLKLGGYLVRQRKRLQPRDAANITNLGVGAMLHDIGMMRLDTKIVERFDKTGDEADPAWREHVAVGHRMVHGRIEPTAAAAVLHHHQRYDGLGFPEAEDELFGPKGLAGESIHIFSRIIAAADLFDCLRYAGSDEPIRTRVRALRLIQQPKHAKRLDPEVLRGLLQVTPPYPPGAVVTLTTGDKAVVTAWSPNSPCRPEVRVLKGFDDPAAELATGPTVDLRKSWRTEIAIAEGQQVLNDNYTFNGNNLWAA